MAGRNVIGVHATGGIAQRFRYHERQLFEETRHRMPPHDLPEMQVECLDRLLGRLLCREARPLMPPSGCRDLGEFQIVLGLGEPIRCPACHRSRSSHSD